MSLKTSEVYRCLEKRTKIFGFEIVDLFFIFSLLALLNLMIGGLPYRVPFKALWTFGPAVGLAVFLKLSKEGKPENFLIHLFKYHFSEGHYSAFALAKKMYPKTGERKVN